MVGVNTFKALRKFGEFNLAEENPLPFKYLMLVNTQVD